MKTHAKPDSKNPLWSIGIVAVISLFALLWHGSPLIKKVYNAETRNTPLSSNSKSHLKSISVALHNYHDQYLCFPPAYVVGKDSKPWHSWRVLILPFMGDDAKKLYAQYRFDEPWNSPNNKLLAEKIPAIFTSSSSNKKKTSYCTPYVAVVGSRTAWRGPFIRRLRDFTDGASNTILLIENAGSQVNWLEPKDMTYPEIKQFYRKRMLSCQSQKEKSFVALFANGRSGIITPKAGRGGRFLTLLTPSGSGSYYSKEKMAKYFPNEGKEETHRSDTYDFGDVKSADDFKTTHISPYLSQNISPKKNTVYCATFQLVWDKCRTTLCDNKPIQVTPQSQMANKLNQHPFPKNSLSKECYTVVVAPVGGIASEVTKQFPGVQPHLTPAPLGIKQLTFYCYLKKGTPFEEDFEVLKKPISFQTYSGKKKIKSFGLQPTVTNISTGHSIFTKQVQLLHYKNKDDFVIRLTTNGKQKDEIYLAKLLPSKTLAETLQNVNERIKKKSVPYDRFNLETVDTLAVPVMELNVEKTYTELVGKTIQTKNKSTMAIYVAKQRIQLRIDETGSVLISEAEVEVAAMSYKDDEAEPRKPPPPTPRQLIFDKPFLMYIKEPKAKEPYFAAWMATTELMELKK